MSKQEERTGDGEGGQIHDPGQETDAPMPAGDDPGPEPDAPIPPGDDPSGIAGGDDPKGAALRPGTWRKRDHGDDSGMANAGRGTEPAEIEDPGADGL